MSIQSFFKPAAKRAPRTAGPVPGAFVIPGAAPSAEPDDFYPLGVFDEWYRWERAPSYLRGASVKREAHQTTVELSGGSKIIDDGKRLIMQPHDGHRLDDAAALINLAAARFGPGAFVVSGPPEFVFKAWSAAEHAGIRFKLTTEQSALYREYKTQHRDKLLAECREMLGPAVPAQKPQENAPKPETPSEPPKPAEKRRTNWQGQREAVEPASVTPDPTRTRKPEEEEEYRELSEEEIAMRRKEEQQEEEEIWNLYNSYADTKAEEDERRHAAYERAEERKQAAAAALAPTAAAETPKPTQQRREPAQAAPSHRTQENTPQMPAKLAQQIDPETAALMEQVRAAQAQLQQQQALLAQRQQVAASVRVWRQTNPTPAADMPLPAPAPVPGERKPFQVRAPR